MHLVVQLIACLNDEDLLNVDVIKFTGVSLAVSLLKQKYTRLTNYLMSKTSGNTWKQAELRRVCATIDACVIFQSVQEYIQTHYELHCEQHDEISKKCLFGVIHHKASNEPQRTEKWEKRPHNQRNQKFVCNSRNEENHKPGESVALQSLLEVHKNVVLYPIVHEPVPVFVELSKATSVPVVLQDCHVKK